MANILISTIVRNESKYLDRYHAQLRDLVKTQPQHQFLLSIYENDSVDGSADKLRTLDWSFLPAYHITTARMQTPHYIGGKSAERVALLADARNRSIFHCGYLPHVQSVFSLEPDVTLTVDVADRLLNQEKHYGRTFDIFTGKSVHPGSDNLYDSWGSRPKAEHSDWADGDGVQDRGLEPMWAIYNCAAVYRADAIRAGHTFGPTNPRTGQPDCDTSVICERFRAAGYGEIYWDTAIKIPHDCS
jgi:hypothetical protein